MKIKFKCKYLHLFSLFVFRSNVSASTASVCWPSNASVSASWASSGNASENGWP